MEDAEAKQWAEAVYSRLTGEVEDYIDVLNAEQAALKANSEAEKKEYGEKIPMYLEIIALKEKLAKTNLNLLNDGQYVSPDSFLGQQMTANNTMKQVADMIRNDESVKAALGDKAKELEPLWLHLVDKVNPNDLMNITTINFDALVNAIDDKYPDIKQAIRNIQNEWGNVAPTDATVVQIRNKWQQIANGINDSVKKISHGTKTGMDLMSKYLWDGSGQVDEYLKKLKSQQDELQKRLYEKKNQLKQMGVLSKYWNKLLGRDIEAEIAQMEKELEAVNSLVTFTQGYVKEDDKKSKKSGGSKSDTRLQTLQEIAQTLEKINKEYDDLQKKEGKSKALEDIKKQFAKTIDYLNNMKIVKDNKLHFDYPTEFKSLQEYRNEILKVMKSLKGLKGGEKSILEFETMIGKADSDELQKQIEKQLKELSDKISRSKEAKEFYDKILSQTGDIELAHNVTFSIYGDTGEDLFKQQVEQIRKVFESGDKNFFINIDAAFDMENQRINYCLLEQMYNEFQEHLVDANKDTAKKIISEGQKATANQIVTWEKELAKAKDYEQQRTDIIQRETQRRIDIIKKMPADTPDQKKHRDDLLNASKNKQTQEIAGVDLAEFKNSEEFIRIFENLDNVTTNTLKNMRQRLEEMIHDMSDTLNPEGLKTIMDAYIKIDDRLSKGGTLKASLENWSSLITQTRKAKDELKEYQAEYNALKPEFDAEISTATKEKEDSDADVSSAKQELLDIQMQLSILQSQEVADITEIANLMEREVIAQQQLNAAQIRQEQAASKLAKAKQKEQKAAKKVQQAQSKVNKLQDASKKATKDMFNSMQSMASAADSLAGVLSNIKDIIGATEDSAAGIAFDSAIEGLQMMSTIMGVLIGIQTIYNAVTESNPWIAIAAAVIATVTILATAISNAKMAKINKQIEKLQNKIDELEYAYERLEKQAEKTFGIDFIQNYNKEIENLYSRAIAYQRQADLERSKGKKKDKEKIKQYEKSWRDTMDEIADMQSDLVESMTDTDVQTAAKDFVDVWLDAKTQFANTADAIKDKYKELVKSMIVNTMASKIMQTLLQPLFDNIDELLKSGDIEGAVDYLVNGMDDFVNSADHGLNTLYNSLEQHGYDMRDILGESGDYTGIARDIASASEESINGLAAGINTQNWYISYVPTISENVAAIRALMEGGNSANISSESIEWKDWQSQSLSNLSAIERHTAETVAECRQIALEAKRTADSITDIMELTSNGKVLRVIMK